MRTAWVLAIMLTFGCADDPDAEKGGDDTQDVDSDGAPIDDTNVEDTDVEDTDPADDTDAADDTDDSDEEVLVDTGGSMSWYHAIQTVNALPQARGFDLDGDGTVNNSMGRVAQQINNLGLSTYGGTDVLAGTAIVGVGPQGGVVDVSILALEDTDGDVTDNFSGVEPFALYGGVPSIVQAAARLQPDGSFEVTLPAGTLALGPLALTTSTEIRVSGIAGPSRIEGMLGTAISDTELRNLLDTFGLGALAALLRGLNDIDADGDGTMESISLAMGFDGPSCVVTP